MKGTKSRGRGEMSPAEPSIRVCNFSLWHCKLRQAAIQANNNLGKHLVRQDRDISGPHRGYSLFFGHRLALRGEPITTPSPCAPTCQPRTRTPTSGTSHQNAIFPTTFDD